MKRISTQDLFESLNDIDQAVLLETLQVNDREALEKYKKMNDSRKILFGSIFIRAVAACLCVTVAIVGFWAARRMEKQALKSNQSNAITSSDYTENAPSSQQVPTRFTVNSMDKLNFYTVKKVIEDNGLLLTVGNKESRVISLDNLKAVYEIDKNTVFTVSMVTYFKINLTEENGFLAQVLGGTGEVEVAITKNDYEYAEYMITFKRGENFYSCLVNGLSYRTETVYELDNIDFSTHKYFEGFYLVKNKEQENYTFNVKFEGGRVTGMDCWLFTSGQGEQKYQPDKIELIEDFCVVLYTKQSLTIAELEGYFSKEG